MKASTGKIQTVEEYIAAAPQKIQPMLRQIRACIQAAAPGAEELIRYDMPAYYLNKKPVIYFALNKKHIAIHPGTQAVVAFADQLSGYACTKGGVHFPFDRPVPLDLITEFVQYRLKSL